LTHSPASIEDKGSAELNLPYAELALCSLLTAIRQEKQRSEVSAQKNPPSASTVCNASCRSLLADQPRGSEAQLGNDHQPPARLWTNWPWLRSGLMSHGGAFQDHAQGEMVHGPRLWPRIHYIATSKLSNTVLASSLISSPSCALHLPYRSTAELATRPGEQQKGQQGETDDTLR
jgi:hypothetical protein